MEKYLICSDVHGDADCFAAVTAAFERAHCARLLILGDLLYHGPRNDLPAGYAPKRVIAAANALADRIVMVRGNCEAEVDAMVLDFHIYKQKHLMLGGRSVYLVHGHHLDKENNTYAPDSVVFYGHTHVPKSELVRGVYYINPGSVSIPKEGSERSYLLFDGETVSYYALDGRLLRQFSLV